MSLLTRKEFDNYDTAVLYVTTCSDVEASFKNSRRFLECKVVGSNPGFNGKDKRYFVQCAEPLRKDGYKLGLYSAEAMVSEYSPFLMSEEFFNELKSDSELRRRWLQEVEELILGENIPEGLGYWQNEVNVIIQELDADIHDIISDIKSDFTTGKMEIIRF